MLANSNTGNEPISQFFSIIMNIVAPISNQITTIGVIVFLVSGLVLALPILPKEMKMKSAGWLLLFLIGGLMIAGAAQYAAYISNQMSFGGGTA